MTILPTINLEQKLLKIRKKQTDKNFNQYLKEVFNKQEQSTQKILSNLNENSTEINQFNFDLLDTSKIFHTKQIKTLCINYRLRFLDSNLFKAKIPNNTLTKIKQLENAHQIDIKGYKIVAPAKLFKLENYDDPLLFAPMGNNYYYLIDKWGNDLSITRKLQMSPVKTMGNFVFFLILLSGLIAWAMPEHAFGLQNPTILKLISFLFILKSLIGIAIFYGISQGKNFSENIWKSKYLNH